MVWGEWVSHKKTLTPIMPFWHCSTYVDSLVVMSCVYRPAVCRDVAGNRQTHAVLLLFCWFPLGCGSWPVPRPVGSVCDPSCVVPAWSLWWRVVFMLWPTDCSRYRP